MENREERREECLHNHPSTFLFSFLHFSSEHYRCCLSAMQYDPMSSVNMNDIRYFITPHHITSHFIISHYITAHHRAAQLITLRHITAQLITAQHITLKHSSSQLITAQRSTAQHNTAHHSAAQHITSRHITAHRITSHHSTSQHSSSHRSSSQRSTANYTRLEITTQHNVIPTHRCEAVTVTIQRCRLLGRVSSRSVSAAPCPSAMAALTPPPSFSTPPVLAI